MKTRRVFQLGLLAVMLTMGVSVATVVVLPSRAIGQTTTSEDLSCAADNVGKILPSCTKCGSCEIADFLKLFQNLYEFGLQLAVPIGMLFLIVGGILLLTASGRSSQIESGKTIIRQSITGIIIVLVSWIIVDTGVYLITGNNKGTIFGKSWYSFDYACSNSELTAGCSGSNVTTWQQDLIKLGYNQVRSNGKYDTATVSATKAFQTDAAKLVVKDGFLSCSSTLWQIVLNVVCIPAEANTCLVPDQQVTTVLPAISGSLDTKTQSLLTTLNGTDLNHNSYSALFQEKCLTK